MSVSISPRSLLSLEILSIGLDDNDNDNDVSQQVEEIAMQALMEEGRGREGQGSLLDDVRPALNLLSSKADGDSGPLAAWTVPQVSYMSLIVSCVS